MRQPSLDLKDKRILNEIEMNACISHAELAKKVGLSKQVVKYRIERLEKERVIQGYFAIIDIARLGYFPHIIYFKFIELSTNQEDKWIEQMNKHPSVMSLGKNAGNWDLTLVVKARNNSELDSIYRELTAGKTDKIKEKMITTQIETTYFTETVFFNKPGKEASCSGKEQTKIDEIDEKIITSLAKDCRISFVELAEKLDMSPNGVKERIKRLEANKIIAGYKTKINYELLGFLHFRVFIHVKKMSQEFYEQVRQYLKSKGNIESITRCWGYADVDYRIHGRDIFEIYDQISELKDKFIDNVIDVDSMIIVGWKGINYYPK